MNQLFNSLFNKLPISLRELLVNKNRNNVALIHIGRCGSSVLASLLSAHQKVHWSGEFYIRFLPKPNFLKEKDEESAESLVDSIGVLKHEMGTLKALRSDVFGFEIKPFHYNLLRIPFMEYVKKLEAIGFTHFVVLDRENRLRKIASSILARKSGKYHIGVDTTTKTSSVLINPESIEIDYTNKPLVQLLEGYDEQFIEVARVLQDRNVLHLTYEKDIQEDPRVAYRKVCEFIDLPPRDNPKVVLKRTNPYPLKELIANFDEVSKALRNTPYGWMVEE